MRCALALAIMLQSVAMPSFALAELPFSVEVDGYDVAYEEFALYAAPGSAVVLQLDGNVDRFSVDYAGSKEISPDGTVLLTAPAAGELAHAEITQRESRARMRINILGTVSGDKIVDGKLEGYRIGSYPSKPLRGNPAYTAPRAFVKLTEANVGTKISPNLTLGRFVCKQTSSFPKFSVMKPKIAWKLERILTELRAANVEVGTFVIMSGYRTPYYNKAIGNVQYSRHVYGDGADIYIDENPRDGIMDDLNGDGRFTKADAEWLVAFIDRLERGGKLKGLIGGLSAYGTTSAHGPFVHVDTRGRLVRW